MHGAVVLLSGGIDSACVLWNALNHEGRVIAVTFDYGQRHRREIESAQALFRAAKEKFPVVAHDHRIIDLSVFGSSLKSSALTNHSSALPEGHYADPSMKATVVPSRNLMFYSIASAIAADCELERVYSAPHAGDHPIYPDCRPEFISAMQTVLYLANYLPVEIVTPFLRKTKVDIARHAYHYDVPIALTWSCYAGGEKHCGKCGTCVERIEAFKIAGIDDPTEYA